MSETSAKKNAIIARRREVAALMKEGCDSVRMIAGKLKRPRSTIGKDVKLIRERWVADTRQDVGTVIARQLIGIQARRAELWEAWRQSKKEGMSETRTDGPRGVETSTTRKVQCGDPRYMNALDALDDREAELFGIHKETVLTLRQVTASEKQRPADFDYRITMCPSEELHRICAEMRAFRRAKLDALDRYEERRNAHRYDKEADAADLKLIQDEEPDWDMQLYLASCNHWAKQSAAAGHSYAGAEE